MLKSTRSPSTPDQGRFPGRDVGRPRSARSQEARGAPSTSTFARAWLSIAHPWVGEDNSRARGPSEPLAFLVVILRVSARRNQTQEVNARAPRNGELANIKRRGWRRGVLNVQQIYKRIYK